MLQLPSHPNILIAGAGPAGLTLSAELRRRGVSADVAYAALIPHRIDEHQRTRHHDSQRFNARCSRAFNQLATLTREVGYLLATA